MGVAPISVGFQATAKLPQLLPHNYSLGHSSTSVSRYVNIAQTRNTIKEIITAEKVVIILAFQSKYQELQPNT